MIKVLVFAAILAITTHKATGQTGTPVALVSIGDKLYLVSQSQLQSLLSPAPPAPRVKTSRKLPPPAPVVAEPEPVDPYPQFSYSYNVNDAETGDRKVASETRDGDNVRGSYSVVEPDGSIRTVTYTADAVNGFRATVDRQQGPVVYTQAAPATTAQPPAYGRRVRVLRRRKLRPTAETTLNEE